MRAVHLAASLGFAAMLVTSRAHADAAADAKDLFDHARDLRAAGDCASAAPLFHKAYDIFPSALGPLRNAAECEEHVGRWASARRTWQDLKRAMLVLHDPKYADWDVEADAAAKRLASRVAHLTVDVSTGGRADDALEVTINGERLDRALVGTTLDRDPGKYVVRAHIATGAPAEQTIELVTGEARGVRLVVAPPGQPLPPQVHEKDHASSSSAWTPAGAVTLAIGLGALVGMGVAIGVRQDALSSLQSQCQDYAMASCPSAVKPTVDRGDAASSAATALAIAGSLVTAAGALMLVVGSVSTKHEKSIALFVSPTGVAIAGRFW